MALIWPEVAALEAAADVAAGKPAASSGDDDADRTEGDLEKGAALIGAGEDAIVATSTKRR